MPGHIKRAHIDLLQVSGAILIGFLMFVKSLSSFSVLLMFSMVG